MKKIYLIAVSLFVANTVIATPSDTLWTQANSFYANGQYTDAIATYKQIEQTNVTSADLYFNMGNAYFKQNELANAILYYERAYRLQPDDLAIAHNLQIVQQRTLDKIEAAPEFVATIWLRNLRNLTTAESWGFLALALTAAALVFLAFFFFASSVRFRKVSFFTAVLCALLVIAAFSFATTQKNKLLNTSEAIVFPAVVTVKSAPDATGKDLFILHEGVKVTIIDELSGWENIRLADGREGWIRAGDTERI